MGEVSEGSDERRPPGQWLITGGCGFIGTALLLRLTGTAGVRVRVLDDLSRGSTRALGRVGFEEVRWQGCTESWDGPIQLVVGGVERREVVDAAARGADIVVHLAANAGIVQSIEDPHRDLEVNVVGTVNVLDSARRRGARRVVLASSAAAVGVAQPPIDEETLPRPSTPYGAGKLAGEAYARAFADAYGLEAVALRFGNVFGPLSGAKDSVVARFVKRWMAGEALVIDGDGEQTRDFIFIEDLVDAVVRAATKPGIGGEVFQISTGSETSIRQIADGLGAVAALVGLPEPRVEYGAQRAGDVRRSVADPGKAERLIGWTARTSLEQGLADTVRWFLDRRAEEATPS